MSPHDYHDRSIRPDRRRRGTLAALIALTMLAGLSGCGNTIARADAYEALADSLFQKQAYPAAIQALNKATQYDSNEPRRWLKLGRNWRALNNPALAAVSYQRALDLDPANGEALQNLAVLLVRAGRYNDAKNYVTPLLMLAPTDIGGLLSSGAIAFYERRYGDADKLATQIIQIAPDVPEGYILRARVYEALGRPRQAAALLSQRLGLDADNIDLATQLLGVYRSLGDLQGIRRTALILARLQPDDVSYQLEAARAHHAAGREDEARAIHDGLLAKYRGSPRLNDVIAEYWITTLPRDQATARIVAMAEQVRGRARATLAARLISIGQAPLAVRLLAPEAASPAGPLTSDAHAAYAVALLSAGREKEAGVVAQEVLNFDANDTAMLVRAAIALHNRKYDAALTDAQQVRENDDDNIEAVQIIVKAYEGKGNLVLARRAFGDALSAMPNDIEMMKAYARWLAAHGGPDDAVDVAMQFMRSHPKSPPALAFAKGLCAELKTAACISAENNRHQAWDL